MPDERIEFGPVQASGLEQAAGASPASFNVILEATGAVRRRPGIVAIPEAPAAAIDANGIAAIHVTEGGDIIAVGGPDANRANIYRIAGGSALNLSSDPTRALVGSARPRIIETEMLLVIAGGGAIQKVQLLDFQSSRLSADAPEASFVVANSLRLLANDLVSSKTTVRYSGIAVGQVTYAGHEDWATADAGTFQAEARPDPVVAIAETANEVLVFGSKSLQVFGSDPISRFVPIIDIDVGCLAGGSVVKVDNQFAWLDDKKRLVMSSGRSVRSLSDPALSQTLKDIAAFDDCFGMRLHMGRLDAVGFAFPTDGRTLVLQQGGGWSQWSGWSSGNYAPWPVLCAHITKGRCLVGMTDGRIGELSAAAHTDLGTPIAAHATTGYQARGTSADKHCEAVNLTIVHEAGAQGLVWLDYRDQPGEWETLPIELDGSLGTKSEIEFRGLGTYRRRQWRVRFDGTTEVVLASAMESYSILR